MIQPNQRFDLLILGSGPAGQKAAIQGAKAGKRVAVVERERKVGGACVHRGTIPSKTLRESAQQMARLQRSARVFDFRLREDLQVRTMVERMGEVVKGHVGYIGAQLERNGVLRFHGRGRFLSEHEVEIAGIDGSRTVLEAETVIIATGARPRHPEGIPVDHANILDSDSILSLLYLPRSLTVLGGGVVGSEYASIFSFLGVKVTLIDRSPRPVRFMDRELTDLFLEAFRSQGGTYHGGQTIESVEWDGVSNVRTRLSDGTTVESDKMLVSLGRVANVERLDLEAAGIERNGRGLLEVDPLCRTNVPHIYAVGDVVGHPGLASSAMEQGRRAARHALGVDPGAPFETIPIGIYSVPEMASVGITEEEAVERHGGAIVGRARFDEIARGLVSGVEHGLLKLVATPDGKRLLGAHIVGEGATELIHLAQMALVAEGEVDLFIENIFNFPTLAEAYRVAALDVVNQRPS